jgi:hypothetical protein
MKNFTSKSEHQLAQIVSMALPRNMPERMKDYGKKET